MNAHTNTERQADREKSRQTGRQAEVQTSIKAQTKSLGRQTERRTNKDTQVGRRAGRLGETRKYKRTPPDLGTQAESTCTYTQMRVDTYIRSAFTATIFFLNEKLISVFNDLE